jgi:rod shape-determining protein MreD
MNALKLLLGLIFAVLVHLVGTRTIPDFASAVDVFLVAITLFALSGNSLAGLLVGLAVGLLQDTLTGSLYGLHAIAGTIVGYSTARLAQHLVIQRVTGVVLVVSFASILQQAVVALLSYGLMPEPALPDPVWVPVKALLCGVLGLLAYAAAAEWSRRFESRRRNRMDRIRLE